MAVSAATASAPPRREDFVESVWQLFSSLRLVIPLIFALALASVAGTFVNPQMASLDEIARSFSGKWWWQLYLAFELHDIFHSWWFMMLLVTLALNIVACTIERLPRIAFVVMNPDRKLTEKVARGLRNVFTLEAGRDAGAEAARVAAAFRARGYEPAVVQEGSTHYLFAQRGRYSRFGVWVVHASLLTLLGGGIAGRFLDWEGTVDVPEGAVFDSVTIRTATGEIYRKKLPFAARVNRFDVEFYKTGTPKLFRSNVSVLGPDGRELRRQDVEVNHPLQEAGVTVYQASYREIPGGGRAGLAVVDKRTGDRREVQLTRAEPLEVDGVTFSVEDYAQRFGDLGPAVKVRRTEGGRSTHFWVFQRRPDFDARNRPDRFGLEFRGLKRSYATGLQVAHHPGTNGFFVGSVMMLAGLIVAFYTVHRRLWARVEPGRIVVAGSTHKANGRFERTLEELRQGLAARS